QVIMANVSSSNGLEKRPKLRFPGFDEPYVLHRIGDIYAERSERGAADMELLSVTMNGGVMQRSEIEGKDNSSEDKSNYKVVRKGDMVYNSMRMWQGANGVSPYDGIVSPAYTVLTAKLPICNEYFAALFKNYKLINEFKKNSQGMTSDTWNLKYPQIKTIKVYLPRVTEQEKVASLLVTLDKRIAAQATLVEQLKKYKRGLLNKVFSNINGNIYPTVYLSKVADFLQGLTYSPSDVSVSGYLVLRSSNIQNGVLSFDDCVYVDKKVDESLQVKCDDVIMCVRNGSKKLVGKTALIPNNMAMTTWGAFMMIIRSKLNDTYIFHYLNSQMFFSQVFKDTGTATINQITKGILNECKLPLPPETARKQISKMLSLFDVKIQNAEMCLTTLVELKKALLQQLFI
ncbi:MAG: restriction endonuclease subunit S, partial [Bacteroides fragilis]